VAPVITGMSKHFIFALPELLHLHFYDFNLFSVSFCITFVQMVLLHL
jgi:hypothetical protein